MAYKTKDGEVLEGFLCPICMEDLVSITQLQVHFEEKHECEDKAVLNSIKGLFNKAKRKLLNDDDDRFPIKLGTPFASEANENSAENPWNWELSLPPPVKSHSSYYKTVRSARIDSFVAETNKLLIRLDKLLTQIPADPVKRKAIEKEIVPWADNKDVPLCPFCARMFNIARRRHHCRLCGAIMCDECSQFLSFGYAHKLVSPVHQGSPASSFDIPRKDEKSHSGPFGSFLGNFHGLRRSGSHGSLNSIISVIDATGKREQAFRICFHCLSRLTARDRQVELRTSKTLLSVYYEKLMDYRNQLFNHIPQYLKMADSLMDGETTYQLADAEQLRMSILKLSDSISITAQKIRNLGASGVALEGQLANITSDGNTLPAEPRQDLLQKRIHSSTVSFLKDNVLGLPKLPTIEMVIHKQERRRRERDSRLMAERKAAKMAEERASTILRQKKAGKDNPKGYSHNSHNSNSNSGTSTPRRMYNKINLDIGWGADTSAHIVTETDDPIVQQMNIIRNYIKQARDASKYDEVSLLEANLKELQIEYKRRESPEANNSSS